MKIYGIFIIMLTLLASCRDKEQQKLQQLVSTWQNKEISFPFHTEFSHSTDNAAQADLLSAKHKILVYVDTTGCTSCKLRLPVWKNLIREIDSVSDKTVSFLFFFHSKNFNEIHNIIERDEFDYPVCFDYQDSLNILNRFPADERFQTFLLDSGNRVKVIGNPIHNPKVKELYLKVITGNSTTGNDPSHTTVSTEATLQDMGNIPQKETQKVVFTMQNTGGQPLIISGTATSCGCVSVNYSAHPVKPGDKLDITVEMKPETEGHFEKTISVYCNTPGSPLLLKIKGQAI